MKFNGIHVPPRRVHFPCDTVTGVVMFSTLSRTFEKEGHEGDDRRLQFGDSEPVGPVVS